MNIKAYAGGAAILGTQTNSHCTSKAVIETKEIPWAIEELSKHVLQLQENVSILSDRLNPVMRPEPTKTQNEATQEPLPHGMLGDIIRIKVMVNNMSIDVQEKTKSLMI